jgi:hypothetical protein
LKENQRQKLGPNRRLREHWWTCKRSVRQWLNEQSIEAAVIYPVEAQDAGGSKGEFLACGREP